MPIRRHRSKVSKVYLPSNSRYNQFLLAEFKITDELLARFESESSSDKLKPWNSFYQKFSEEFFTACEQADIENVHFIANDKLPRVRFNQEVRYWETDQQMLMFYNPAYHQSYKSHFDGSVRAKKISLMFLATGDSIRSDASAYHAKVREMLAQFLPQVGIPLDAVRLRDHQHLTYDLYARDKGFEGSHGHTLRLIKNRYKAGEVSLPEQHDTMSYVVASLPITRRLLKRCDIDLTCEQSYDEFYKTLNDAFVKSATHFNLKNGAFIADGLTPIVRNSDNKPVQEIGELVMLGFDPKSPKDEFVSQWKDDHLVDYAQIIYAATEADIEDKGYSKFMDTVDKSLRMMAKDLEMTPDHDELTVRFHQHLAYHFSE